MSEQIHLTREDLAAEIRKMIEPLLAGTSHLLLALAALPGRIPDPVMDAAEEIRRAVVALGGAGRRPTARIAEGGDRPLGRPVQSGR